MLEMDKFDAIQISLASPEKIRSWSYGEVKKPETINYRTHKPERDGLFCERIFGPTKDWECFCGKYKSIRYRGIICERCNVEITKAAVRRERMGHIQLVTPVAHIWYSKGSPSYTALLLDISARDLEKVLYFQQYIVIDPGNLPLSKKQLLPEEGSGGEMGYRELREKYGDMFVAKMGAEAIKELLAEIDLKRLEGELALQLKSATGSKRAHLLKRLDLVKMFARSVSRPEWMILDVLPVIPPDLRPMVQLDGGRFATSDLNDLYRRVINRNNRLKRLIKLQAPEIIIKNEKRMLQEAVNALIDNGRRGKLVTGPNNRPLKSLTDMLKGKQGRFRQNLLGKRVDYSGRSVIVVGPRLKLHQAGLPKKMALELFKPFVMHRLVQRGIAFNIKNAKKLIEREKSEVWDVLEEVIRHHPILLNRAPTLHRLGIQAFEPVLIEGKAIQIHPLVCAAYNADFDGDQMAVHVPLMLDAQIEARMLMLASNNILKPADGNPIVTPTQDMTIGIFYLTSEVTERVDRGYFYRELSVTTEKQWTKLLTENRNGIPMRLAEPILDKDGKIVIDIRTDLSSKEMIEKLKKFAITSVKVFEPPVFSCFDEAINAYMTGQLDLQWPVYMHRSAFPAESVPDSVIGKDKDKSNTYLRTTVGRLIFNTALPLGPKMAYNNNHIRKGDVGALIRDLYNRFPLQEVGRALDVLKELGFRYATLSGLTISMVDLLDPPRKREIIAQAERKAQGVMDRWEKHEISRDERTQAEIDIWIKATEEVTDDLLEEFKKTSSEGDYNSVYMMAYSGARGNMQQIRQLAAMRGLMSNPHGDILAFPIKSNFREGLNQTEYFISTYGARKGLVDTALRTADSGYLTRRLVDVAQDVVVTIEDCKTNDGIVVHPIRKARTSNNILVDDVMVPIRYKIAGRVLAKDIVDPVTGKTISVLNKHGEKVALKADLYVEEDVAGKVEGAIENFVPIDDLKVGMVAAEQIMDNKNNRIILRPDREINEYILRRLRECNVAEVKVRSHIVIRSPLTCKAKSGICRRCYGSDLATTKHVDVGEAVGIVAAQSIGEPGTQLTMRTFHLGGVALAQRSYIKAKVGGKLSLEHLKRVEVSDRTKFEIGSGTETFDKTEYDANVRKVVVGGHMVINTKDGKRERVHIPEGSEIPETVKEGMNVTPGTPLAEFNPNNIVTSVSGEAVFEDIEIKDGMVVSEHGKVIVQTNDFDPATHEFKRAVYEIPQGASLRVEDTEIVHAGNVLAETAIETRAAISRINGIVHFENIRVKNKQVISDRGMIFVFPKDSKKDDYEEYKLPKSVKETKDASLKTGGMVLNVKNGDAVYEGDKLLSVVSEIDGTVSVAMGKKTVEISKEVIEDHVLQGEIAARIDEKNRTLSLLAPISGSVRVMQDKSAANKTLDRRKVIIKNEVEYQVPRGVILRPKEHFKVQNGEQVEAGTELTTPLMVQAEIDGTVEIVKIKGERVVHLIKDDLSVLKNASLARSLINRDTGEEYAREGQPIDETLMEIIEANRYQIREVWIAMGECKAVRVRGEEHAIDYPVESGTIKVENGQNVKAGDKLIVDVNPIVAEIGGKVNYIYNYNKTICEDIIEKVLIYSGVEFNYPATLSLKFNEQVLKDGELTVEPITFEEYQQLDGEGEMGGLLIKKKVRHEKKYRLTDEMMSELLVEDGDEVRENKTLAVLKVRNKGVVLLDRKESKEGKSRNTIERIVVQAGEAYQIMDGAELRVEDGKEVQEGEILAKWGFASKKTTDIIQGLPRVAELFEVRRPKKEAVVSEKDGIVRFVGTSIEIEDLQGNVSPLRHQFGLTGLVVHDGEYIEAGDPITEGKIFPKKMAKLVDLTVVQRYLVDEVQRVYREQGVTINDKHIEIIVRQMLRKRMITDPGDTEWLPNDTVHVKQFEEKNRQLLEAGKRPAHGAAVIQGITKASLTTDSFISAASFQETTRVLTKAAIRSKVDRLRGLKENLIIGKLIPAGTGVSIRKKVVFKNLPVEISEESGSAEELFLQANEAAGEVSDAEEALLLGSESAGVLDDGGDEEKEDE